MKTRNIIFYLIGLLALTSCDDMFEPTDENNRQLDAMYEESNYAHGLLMYAYDRLPYITTCQTDVATDDAVTNVKSNDYKNMTTGAWTAENNPMSQWNGCKDGIQYANLFLTVVDKVNWAQSAKSKQQMFVDRMKGEALALRAILYYHLLQAHGGYAEDGKLYGVPLLTAPEDGSSDFNQPRALFSECVKQCFADCDSAIALLPYDYVDISDTIQIPVKYRALGAQVSAYNLVLGQKARGLISGKVAEAVKAQIALLASSPAFSDQSGVTSEEAAKYCAAVLKHIEGAKGLDPTGNIWYRNKAKIDNSTEMAEIIWRLDRGAGSRDQELANFPPSLFGSGQVNPSQNLVDAFPMLNGYPITDKQNSGYNEQDPYTNRDPRLALAVIYNGVTYKGTVICTGVNMPNAEGKTVDNLDGTDPNTTLTGYYMAKLLRDDVVCDPSGPASKYHIFPRIRYTELFLAYAEAANEAWGPTDDKYGVGSAYDIIKAIRERAGLGKSPMGQPLPEGDAYLEACKGDKAKMRELIRNERRIELCFENKRFWDLRRWKMPLNETVQGMRITLDPNKTDGSLIYTRFNVEERKFDSSYQWYGPLPMDECLKWSKLDQNKDW